MDIEYKLKTPIEIESEKNKKKIKSKYNVDIYISIPREAKGITLHTLHEILLKIVNINDPDLMIYTDFTRKTRTKQWMMYQHSFCHIAYSQLCYTKSDIGKYIGKTHATVINAIKKSDNYLWYGEFEFKKVYESLLKEIKKCGEYS